MSAEAPAPTSAFHFQRLAGFVRRLIDYGRDLAASFQRGEIPLDPAQPGSAAYRFGTSNLRIILARIARGLLLAEALQARLFRQGEPTQAPAPPATAPARAPARAASVRAPRRETDREPDPDNLPTAAMIAEAVRHRPIGAVLADICRDLGITPSHPAWPEMFGFLIGYGGQLAPLIVDTMARVRRVLPLELPARFVAGLTPAGLTPIGTGPPWPACVTA